VFCEEIYPFTLNQPSSGIITRIYLTIWEMQMRRLRALPVPLAFAFAFQAAITLTAKAAPAEQQIAVVMAEICLWSDTSPVTSKKPTCQNVQLTPGEAGPSFPSIEACKAGLAGVMKKWFAAVREILGFEGYAGKGYNISARCSLRSRMPNLGS
jgi:hypothetical protein